MNYSKQRNLILSALQEHKHHPTADQIYNIVKEKDPNISLATVYRNLNQLAENGIIQKVEHIDTQAHFDHTLEDHYHFICSECSCIIDIDCNIVSNLNQQLLDKENLLVENTDISFHGLCPKCRNKQQKTVRSK